MATQLQSLQLVAPAFMGLNKDFSGSLLGPEWAVEANNAVFDRSGRLSARKGWQRITQANRALDAHIEQAFEFRREDGTTEVVFASNNKLYRSPESPEDITGEAEPRGNRWQFANFNGKVIGVQYGHTPVVYDGTGSFTNLTASSGTVPNGDAILAAFGRVWIVGLDGETIYYSGLLDETDWGSASSGHIDMRRIWTRGTDKIIGLAALGSTLVVFGTQHIIMWVDGSGSEIGLNPRDMYVVDTIEGTGLICRDSIQVLADGDVLYLSNYGLQSLQRVLQHKTNPIVSVAPQVLTYINGFIQDENLCQMRSAYSPTENFYLLSLPQANRTFVFDTRELSAKGITRVTEWQRFAPRALLVRENNDLLFGMNGVFGKYGGHTDNGQPYRFVYRSGWMDLRDTFGKELSDRLKILKEVNAIVYIPANASVVFKWAFDFDHSMRSKSVTFSGTNELGEWGLGQWGISEWSGGQTLHDIAVKANGTGQFVQLGIETIVEGAALSLQHVNLQAKIGRRA